ncbi:Fur family transcriptional regulator [Olivibacter sitiensis]|uniref:Fur family transcriptional regulator n=1 Tax=Olivibacter sitiensis TaxID=376470 RepID=UPI0009FF8A57|nr:transcriptional repressor [Olivibacter sitiensis]
MKNTRNTRARTEILNLITSSEEALSHSQIQSSLKDLCDRFTIYRVLDRLTYEGIIHKVVNIDGVIRYAKCHNCDEKHHPDHIHFSCEQCHTVTCLEDVEPQFKLPKKYKVHEVNFTVSGICPSCS